MLNQVKAVELALLVGGKDYRALRDALSEMHEVDVAQFIEELPKKQSVVLFRLLPKDQAMEVFAELSVETQERIASAVTDDELSDLVEELAVDDAVDMLEEMPAALVKRVLKTSSHETRSLINQFLHYPDDSAGSIMTAEYTNLRRDMTVEAAIKRIRRTGEDRETIYNCYVTDDSRLLVGVVTVKDILLARDDETVESLMETNIISVATTEDRETAVNLMAKYDLMSLPVVDAEGRLVGIVTIDDAMDAMQEEATEDFQRMSAMAPSERPYLRTGVLSMARNRVLWLTVLMVSAMITGYILGLYEEAFIALPLLVTFIPMLTDTGGNAGSQSSTMVIRGMALGEISTKDAPAIVAKELGVSLLVGVPLAVVNYARVLIGYPGQAAVGLTVSLAMLITVGLANTIGGILPILAKLFRADPALMASPLIATLVDAMSLVVYFTVATLLLPV
ncbi:magnesium transporter [Synergistaceae bacterium OttesenSCG-928-I11]|nr:magnesium transporter [Synergistaceae bacterium OttesenSCG-928-I11]